MYRHSYKLRLHFSVQAGSINEHPEIYKYLII